MSMGVAFASAFFGEINEKKRAQAAAQREAAIKAEERQAGYDLATFKAGLDERNIKLEAKLEQEQKTREFEQGKPKRLREQYSNQLNALSDDQKLMLFQDPEFLKGYNEAFGTGITSEMAQTMADISDAADYTTLGNVKLPFTIDTGKDEDVFAGVDRMELYLAQNPEFINKIDADEKTKEAVTAYVGTLYNNYNAFWHKKFSMSGDDGKYTSHAYRDWSKGLSKFSGLAKKLGIIDQNKFNAAPVDLENDEVFVPETQDTASTIGYVAPLEGIADQYGTNSQNLTQLASYHEMPQGGGQLFSNIDYLTYGEDSKTDLSKLMIDEDKMQAISLGSVLLSVGAKDIMLLKGGASTSVLNESTKVLNIAGHGDIELNYADEDVGAMRRAFFVVTKPDAVYADQLPNHLTGVDGVTYATNQGYDVKGFREQNSATDEAVEMLQELVRLQSDYGATGLVAKVEAFALGVVGQAKQASDIFLSGDPVYDTFNQDLKEGTSASDLLKTVKKYIPEKRLEQLSKMDALRLTLAAKMARAVDPSGRLSNQDFEIQLQRLGGSGWFTDQKGALTKLNTVLEEFERRQTSNQDLLSIINKDNITVEDRRFIKASNAVNVAIAHRRKTQVRAETAAAPGQAVPESVVNMKNYVPIPDKDGNETGMFARIGGSGPEVINADGADMTAAYMGTDNTAGQGTN
jgi:hypothetical protein